MSSGADGTRPCVPARSLLRVVDGQPVEERAEGTRANTGHEAEPDALTKGLMAIAWAFRRTADVLEEVLADREIQLAAGRGQSVMAAVPTDLEPAEPTAPDARLLTLADLAAELLVNAKTVRRWRTEGKLPAAVEIGGVVRWRREDVDAWLAAHVGGAR